MKAILSLISAALAFTLAAPAQAQFAKPEDAIKYRKASLTVMSAHFARLGAMANGRVPYDAKAAADNAEVVSALAKLPWAAFGEAPTRAIHGPNPTSGKSRPSSKKRQTKWWPKWAN